MADNSIARVQRNMMKEMDKMFDSFFSSYSDRRMPSVDISGSCASPQRRGEREAQ